MNLRTYRLLIHLIVILCTSGALLSGADWPEWRGPARTGVSTETGLPSSWSPAGENLAWRVPVGSRSAPVVFGDRLYLQTSSGANETLQERIICFHADTGKVLWDAAVRAPCHWQPVVASGWVYAGLEDGSLVGIHTGDPADDGWPMWGGGAGHNGQNQEAAVRQ